MATDISFVGWAVLPICHCEGILLVQVCNLNQRVYHLYR